MRGPTSLKLRWMKGRMGEEVERVRGRRGEWGEGEEERGRKGEWEKRRRGEWG